MPRLRAEKIPEVKLETDEISLRLEQYDDIFSDFDIRPYSSRALSVDFLEEIKRAALDKDDGGVEVFLHMPKKLRDKKNESIIAERLVAHFRKHYHLALEQKKKVKRMGFLMIFFGVVSMFLATFVMYKNPGHNFLYSFLVIFLEPAAWFLWWEGADQIIFTAKKLDPQLDFYRKMSHTSGHINFESY